MPDVSTRLVLSIGLIVVAVGALDSLISKECTRSEQSGEPFGVDRGGVAENSAHNNAR
jgi:hypothetical protein